MAHGTMATWSNQCLSIPWIEDSQVVASKTDLIELVSLLNKLGQWLRSLDCGIAASSLALALLNLPPGRTARSSDS